MHKKLSSSQIPGVMHGSARFWILRSKWYVTDDLPCRSLLRYDGALYYKEAMLECALWCDWASVRFSLIPWSFECCELFLWLRSVQSNLHTRQWQISQPTLHELVHQTCVGEFSCYSARVQMLGKQAVRLPSLEISAPAEGFSRMNMHVQKCHVVKSWNLHFDVIS